MINRDSAEYKTVTGLYRDGKINAQERNKLLSALGFEGDGQKTVTYRVDGMDSEFCAEQVRSALEAVEGVDEIEPDISNKHVDVTGDFDAGDAIEAVKAAGYMCRAVDIKEHETKDVSRESEVDGDAEKANDGEADGLQISIKDGRSLGEFLSGLGEKISKSVQAGIKTASSAIDSASEKIKKAASGITGSSDARVIKRIAHKYDEPYEKLTVDVTYTRRGRSKYNCHASARNIEKIKNDCRASMSDAAYEKTVKILDEKFTGVFKYVCGDDSLRIIVEPDE